jgi:hypothetical protein
VKSAVSIHAGLEKAGVSMHFPLFRYSKFTLCFISITLLGVSCSSNGKRELSPVRGKVLVKDKPAAGVTLLFIPAVESSGTPLRPLAITSEDGSFTVTTDEEQGAPPGEYTVTMTWMQDAPPPAAKKGSKSISMQMGGDRVDKLGGKYRDPKKGFKVTLKKGANDLEPFKLQ